MADIESLIGMDTKPHIECPYIPNRTCGNVAQQCNRGFITLQPCAPPGAKCFLWVVTKKEKMQFNTAGFSSIYQDLEDKWDKRMDVVKAGLDGSRPTEPQRTEVQLVISKNGMNFELLTFPEAVLFLQIALPWTFLYEAKMRPSPFLKLFSE